MSNPSEADILARLLSLGNGALRRIADTAELIIEERNNDGVTE